MNKSDVEARLPKSLFILHEFLTKVLKDNNILQNNEAEEVKDDKI